MAKGRRVYPKARAAMERFRRKSPMRWLARQGKPHRLGQYDDEGSRTRWRRNGPPPD